ncbi:MAG: crotonase/enoyl-CoA hydratase family protein [Thermoleophilia bacterium]|nr:crotonase/enoyl-CoA hydratase family protein [Thermoleophilia bacterium]
MTDGGQGIRVKHRDGTVIVTIDRPAVRNAVDLESARRIAAALDELDRREDLLVGVITGAGGGFSAGMDLKALAATGERPVAPGRGPFGLCARPPDKPLIAAVEGTAFGGGFEIALACDCVVAARDSLFALPEVKRGLVAAAGGVLRLPARIPRNVALEMAITGEPIGAARAYELGLVNRLTAPGGALDAALEMAAQVAANAPLAVRATKSLVESSANWPPEQMFDHQQPLVQSVRESADAAEGTRAFVEKRPPRWTGK